MTNSFDGLMETGRLTRSAPECTLILRSGRNATGGAEGDLMIEVTNGAAGMAGGDRTDLHRHGAAWAGSPSRSDGASPISVGVAMADGGVQTRQGRLEEMQLSLRAISSAVLALEMLIAGELEQQRAHADDMPLDAYYEAAASGALDDDDGPSKAERAEDEQDARDDADDRRVAAWEVSR